MEKQTILYAEELAQLIKCKTITNTNEFEFKKFRKTISSLFPYVFKHGNIKEFDKGILVIIKGESAAKPILFMNHHDVVEASGEWENDPFLGLIKNNKIYGRGTLDTKGGFYCMCKAMDELLLTGFKPKQDIYLLSTSDEEAKGICAQEFAKYFQENNITFRYILDAGGLVVPNPIGDDGDFAMIATGEKGLLEAKVRATGNGGHSGAPSKNSPLVRLSKFVLDIENTHSFKGKMSKTVAKSFNCFAQKSKGIKKIIFKHAKLFSPLLKLLSSSLPELGAMLKTTVAFTMSKGSEQTNVIPSDAFVVLNVRIAPHDSVESVMAVLNKYASKYDLKIEILIKSNTNSVSSYLSKDYLDISNAILEIFPESIVCPYVSNTASDSRFLRCIADNVYGFVPFKINAEQLNGIHGNNESLDIENLPKAVHFYKTLMEM